MAGDTRARMLAAATEALRRGGVAGMSFTEVLDASGAARGAIYHHFPGGKAQLVSEAAAQHGTDVRDHLAALSGDTPAAVVLAFLTAVRPIVAASAAGSGCAVAAAALGPTTTVGPTAAPPSEVAAAAFGSWIDALTAALTTAGAPPTEAAELATALITLLEGAHVLCRASGHLGPFERATSAMESLVSCRYPG